MYITYLQKIKVLLHLYVYFSFISRVESIMHKASLAELMGCTIILCLMGYYTIMVG